MAVLEKNELLKYIKAAIDLETDIVTQENIIQQYNLNSQSRKPVLYLYEEPEQPVRPEIKQYHGVFNRYTNDIQTGALILAAVILVFGLIMVISMKKYEGIPVVLVPTLLCCMPFLLKMYKVKKKNEQLMLQYDYSMKEYKNELKAVTQENLELTEEFNSNYTSWESSDKEMVAILSQHLAETKDILKKLYSQDVIYEKYRNLPALTSMYEYLMIGRCDELSGPHGAYNLYEDEIRKDTVISQLNTVIEHLDQIKQNQYLLYQQAKMITENTSVIANEIHQIKGYTVSINQLTALNTYYAAQTARNTDISATFHIING